MLVVSGPLLAVEEIWNGRPLIDENNLDWVPFAVLVAAAFLCGGVLAGRFRRGIGAASVAGLACGIVAVLALVAADLVRRLAIVGEGIPFDVVSLWLVAGGGGIGLSMLGGLLGASRHRHAAGDRVRQRRTHR